MCLYCTSMFGCLRNKSLLLVDFGISFCFNDLEFLAMYKKIIIKKSKVVYIKIIDSQFLFFRDITHENNLL